MPSVLPQHTQLRHTPFDKQLSDVLADDLATLKNVYEGWYVEYKSDLVKPRALAKSLSSFANQYGGWIFLGVSEDKDSHTATRFSGISNSAVPQALESLKNASKDLLNPAVFYDHRVFKGPIQSIGLREGHSIILVRVPQGPDSPYVHADGRVYRRIADSSDPKPEADRSTLDLLYERGALARNRLEDRIMRSPVVSKDEEDECFAHFNILSDPYEVMGHRYDKGFPEFSNAITAKDGNALFDIPFDNIFTTSGGFIARQTTNQAPYNRLFTWEFSRNCHSFISLPIPTLVVDPSYPSDGTLANYSIGNRFLERLADARFEGASKVLDLNVLLKASMAIIGRHRSIVGQASVNGPFYIKVRLENIWRKIPFVDLPEYLDHISEYGIPINQETDVLVPPGASLNGFLVIPEFDFPLSESDKSRDGVIISMRIFQALGIPGEILARAGPDQIITLLA